MREGLPVCSRHPGAHVTLRGRYGPAGARRQLYRSVSDDGTAHRFVGSLARRMLTHPSTCDTCETRLHVHEGPATPLRHTYAVREVAAALVAVANGATYAQAAEMVRDLAGRRATKKGFGSQVVGAWVETLGPVVCAPYGEAGWCRATLSLTITSSFSTLTVMTI